MFLLNNRYHGNEGSTLTAHASFVRSILPSSKPFCALIMCGIRELSPASTWRRNNFALKVVLGSSRCHGGVTKIRRTLLLACSLALCLDILDIPCSKSQRAMQDSHPAPLKTLVNSRRLS